MNQHKPALFVVCIAPQAIEWFFNGHLEALRDRYRVTVLTNLGLFPELTKTDGVNYISIPSERAISVFKDMVSLFVIGKIIVSIRPKTVIGLSSKSSLLSLPLSRMFGVRDRVHIFQGQVWANFSGLKKQVFKMLDRFIWSCTTKGLCVSESERIFLINSGIVNKEGRLPAVLGAGSICGVRPSIVLAAKKYSSQLRQAKTKDNLALGYVGRIHPDKGIDLLFEICRELKLRFGLDHSLTIAGPVDGIERGSLINKANQLGGIGVDVKLIPELISPEIIYPRLDLLVIPSSREGFCNAVIEAAVFGVPSIGSDIPGLRDSIAHNRTGILSERDAVAFAEAIKGAWSDGRVAQLGREARSRAKKEFSHECVISLFVQFIEERGSNDPVF